MAKKDKDQKSVEKLAYEDSADLMREARLRGRNDLIDPKGKTIEIAGPYGARVAAPVGEATGDDDNTPSTAAGTGATGSTNRTQ